jgi:hypothetical protein
LAKFEETPRNARRFYFLDSYFRDGNTHRLLRSRDHGAWTSNLKLKLEPETVVHAGCCMVMQ